MSARRAATIVLAGALALGGCSVTTPRHESLAARQTRLANADTETSGEAGGTTGATDSGTGADLGATQPIDGSPAAQTGAASASASGTAAGSRPATSAGGAKSGSRAAATGAVAPGVTKDTITISIIAGFSGPLAAVVENAYQGIQTWQDDVNAAGGIHGRKVALVKVDHKETADGGVAACKEAESNNTYFAAVLEGTEANLTAISCLDAAGIPTLYFASSTDPKWKRAFSDSVTSAQSGPILASLVRARVGAKKIGVIYVNQPAYKAAADTFAPAAKRLGAPIVGTEAVEPNQASFTSQLLRLKNAGAEVVLVSATAEAIGVLRDAKSMGWQPQFVSYGATFDFVTVASRNLFDGVLGLRGNATVDTPAYEKYAARMEARGRGHDRTADVEAFLAYGHALLIGEMLQRAGATPTRDSLVTGTESIHGYDNGILPPLQFGPGDHVGAEAAFATVCCNEDWTWKGQGPPRTSF